jgi:ABC-type multidrug transport system ATPase subunit
MHAAVNTLAVVCLLFMPIWGFVGDEPAPPPFPCLLDHGCVCNHSGVIVKNVYDQQYYAPCDSCGVGWTGPLCNVLDTPCMNGGYTDNASSGAGKGAPCVCPVAWSGHSCEDVECPNSENGHGPFHVAAPNAVTQSCSDDCLPGWSGVQCGLCSANSACQPYAGAQGACDTSLVARGSTKHLECDVTNPRFLKPLGHNVGGHVTMDCSTKGDVPMSTSGKQAECTLAFFRIEENASFVDPFFFCTARNCSMEVTMEKDATSSDPSTQGAANSAAFDAVRKLGQTALLVECALLAMFGQAAKMLPKKLVGRALLVTTGLLVITFIGYVVVMVGIMNHNSAPARSVVAYRCDAAHCVCAQDPPAIYTPICSSSAFGKFILPTISNGMDLICHTDDNRCAFTPRDAPTQVDLSCRASECVNTNTFPDIPVVGGGGGTSSSGGNSKQKDLLVVAIAVGFAAVGAVALHLYVTFQKTWASSREFVELFLTDAAAALRQSAGTAHHRHHRHDLHERTSSVGDATPSAAQCESELRNVPDAVPDYCSDESSDFSEESIIASPTVQVYQPINNSDVDDEQDDIPEDQPLNMTHSSSHHEEHQRGVLHRKDVHAVMSAPICLQLRRLSYQLRPPSCAQGLTRAAERMFRTSDSLVAPRATVVGNSDVDVSDASSSPLTKQILNEVTFTVCSGEVLALMGPSGAGKTTLLDLLAMRLKSGECTGTLEVNGVAISSDQHKQQYRAMLGYVSQEDTLLPSLTVRETVYYAAKLKLPTSFGENTIEHIVASVLRSLRLDRCAETLVGDGASIRGVSGGERRRVSIAVELVANPRILFLDEPTSGLDAVSARVVMEAVAQLARSPPMQQYAPHFFAFAPIVVFSIHQPSRDIYELFDKVLLLSRGVAVYYGVAVEAVPYVAERLLRSPREDHSVQPSFPQGEGIEWDDGLFQGMFPIDPATRRRHFIPPPHENPADVLMKLEDRINEHLRDDLRAERAVIGLATGDGYRSVTPLKDKDIGRQVLALTIASRKYYPNVWQQMRLLSQRSLSALLGSFELIVCHALVTCVVGALMCVLYEHEALDLPGSLNRAGSITFLLLVISFVSLSGLDPLLSERKLLVVERENGYYGTLPYLLTKLLVDVLPLRVISVGVLGAVIYFPMGLRTDDGIHFVWFIAMLCLFSVCMTFMTFSVGIVLGSFGPAALTSAVVVLWNFVFGGLLVQADTIPYVLAPFRRISPFFLTFEALLVNELNGQLCTFAPTDATGKPSSTAIPLFCVQYLENLGLHPSRFAGDVALLGVMTLLLLLIVYALLRGIKTIR